MRARPLAPPFFARVAQQQRQHVESVSSAGANPVAGTISRRGIRLKGGRLSYKQEAAEHYRHPLLQTGCSRSGLLSRRQKTAGIDAGRFGPSTQYPQNNLYLRSSMDQSTWLRTRRLQVRVLPGVPCILIGNLSIRPRSPTSRGAGFRTRRLGVQIPPWVPVRNLVRTGPPGMFAIQADLFFRGAGCMSPALPPTNFVPVIYE